MTNFDYRHFKAENRVAVTLESLKFSVLDELFAEGEKYIATIEAEKAKHRKRAQASLDGLWLPARGSPSGRRGPRVVLRKGDWHGAKPLAAATLCLQTYKAIAAHTSAGIYM